MGAQNLSYSTVAFCIKRFGPYRTKRTQAVAAQGEPDGIAGKHLIALGLRETNLTNVNGGAIWADGEWKRPPWFEQDAGVFQISRKHNAGALKLMPGVQEGTWQPVCFDASGDPRTAYEAGLVPRFEESLQYTVGRLGAAQKYGRNNGVPESVLPRFSIAAHNAGFGGALAGYRDGDVDLYTTYGDYSAWIWRHSKLVSRWLFLHPRWRA
jgi:hypothetical protein